MDDIEEWLCTDVVRFPFVYFYFFFFPLSSSGHNSLILKEICTVTAYFFLFAFLFLADYPCTLFFGLLTTLLEWFS